MDFVRENPEEAMKAFKASKEVNASMAKNPSKWLKAGRWTMRELGPLGLIGGEILFGGVLTMMELGQGKDVWEAMDNGFLYGLAGVEDKTLLEYANRFENITDEEKEYIKKALDISKKAPEYEKILQTMSNMDPSKLTTTEPGARGMGRGERPTPYARYKTLADKKLAEIQEIKGDMTKDQATAGSLMLKGLKMSGFTKAELLWRPIAICLYILNQAGRENFNEYDKIYFAGDRCFKNGNDKELYDALVEKNNCQSFNVRNPQDTINIIKNVIKESKNG